MPTPEVFVDTDVIVRYLTGDDPSKQADAATLFEAVESETLVLVSPITVIADTVFVLSSSRLYRLPRPQIQTMLASLLRFPCFKVDGKHALLAALELYATTKIDFGDAMIVVSMRDVGSTDLCSYDAHFDQIPDITRRPPVHWDP